MFLLKILMFEYHFILATAELYRELPVMTSCVKIQEVAFKFPMFCFLRSYAGFFH